MGFGRRRSGDVPQPLIEPLWEGIRVLVHVEPGGVARIVDGGGTDLTSRNADVAAMVASAVDAETAVFDGYLTAQATRSGAGAAIVVVEAPTASQMVGQMFLGKSGERAISGAASAPELPHDRGELVAFVAVDLLELDGTDLLGVPLLERKRLLDGALAESDLVRVGLYVRPPVEPWLLSWRSIGFKRIALKAQNGRYLPGADAEDWATADIPRR
jgi:bifunctional non-homologous end joining protein LigD